MGNSKTGKAMGEFRYKISLLTPVYNAQEYLEVTLANVIEQSIGFEENVQWTLVNDGSTDKSGEICAEFKSRFPDNVSYTEKENGGVSSARNEGLRHIQGKYTIFLDADDLWDKDAFRKISEFFDAHYDEIDVCTCNIKYIGDFADREHPQSVKFNDGTKVINLEKQPNFINTPIGNCAFKSEALKGKSFDEDMTYCEDTFFLSKVISEKKIIGALSDAVFYYRKNFGEGNASISIPKTPAWYFDIPRSYYMKMINFALDKFGNIPKFIQETLVYDIKWRGYAPEVIKDFTEEQKKEHIALMREVLSHIDDEVIMGATGVNQYKKLYLLELKHNKDLIAESTFKNDRFYYEGIQIMSLRGRSMLFFRSFDIRDGVMEMEGVIRSDILRRPHTIIVRDDQGKDYEPLYDTYPDGDLRGFVGEMISEGKLIKLRIPMRSDMIVRFYISFDGMEIPLRPTFDDHIGIDRGRGHNYTVKNGYIIKLRKNELSFYKDTKLGRLYSELRLDIECVRKGVQNWRHDRQLARRIISLVNDARLKNRIAFVSARSDEGLMDNLKAVYELSEVPKVQYSNKSICIDPEKTLEAAKITYTSKVVVTDDYMPLFRDNKKKDGQFYVQLWHAAGAFKKFGREASNTTPGMDGMYHRDYDLVTVSSEYVREIYADAFQIDINNVQALGVPRCDRFFDEVYLEETKNRVLEKHPEIKDKQVIVYAPTFRGKANQRIYMPAVDYSAINNVLSDEQIMIICPHPLMPKYEGRWDYDRIKVVRDVATSDMMIAADLLVTDYSSVIFEYSLLDKPMAFFCYDYDEYDRDFYLDYETDLPGIILKTEEAFREYISKGLFETDDRLISFREKYMSACDGRCSKRIAEAVSGLLNR